MSRKSSAGNEFLVSVKCEKFFDKLTNLSSLKGNVFYGINNGV
jgi:hypothetical protein